MLQDRALTGAAADWLKGRGISRETAEQYGLWGQKARSGGEWLVTPFFKDDKLANNKYRLFDSRDPEVKRFQMEPDHEVLLWNFDILRDPALHDPANPLVITEGEMDALAVIEAGHPWVVSVPNGASLSGGELAYLESAMPFLRNVARYVIATDADKAGAVLKQALIERLSLPRCFVARYPDGCKDFNEVLLKHGKAGVARGIAEATPIPYQGTFYAWEFQDFEQFDTIDLKIGQMDKFFRPFPGSFTVVTGIPSSGKSLFVQQIALKAAKEHGIKSVIGSFENRPPQVIKQLREMYAGSENLTGDQYVEAQTFINGHFFFCVTDAPAVSQLNEVPVTTDLAWFLDAAATFVIRDGAKMVILDPWNQISHKRDRSEDQAEYIERALMEITRFAQRFNVFFIVVAHPHKIEREKKDGWFREVNLYDISGSAAWFNKPDFGICLHRPGGDPEVKVNLDKVRMRGTGKTGNFKLRWVDGWSRYENFSD